MRGAAILPGIALLAACSAGDSAEQLAAQEPIWCALAEGKAFAQDCTVERGRSGDVATFVVRHPDGAFHRLVASKDGRQLLSADGAALAQSARKHDRYEVILGDARYVIPLHATGQ